MEYVVIISEEMNKALKSQGFLTESVTDLLVNAN